MNEPVVHGSLQPPPRVPAVALDDVSCARCGHAPHGQNYCRADVFTAGTPSLGTLSNITICNCPPLEIADVDELRKAHEETERLVGLQPGDSTLTIAPDAGPLMRTGPMRARFLEQALAGLTPDWCWQAFRRANPGAPAGLMMNLPSAYLLDFAREVLRAALDPSKPT